MTINLFSILLGRGFRTSWREILSLSPERINKIWNEIFVGGFFLDDFFLVFHDDFVVGDFDDFLSWNGEFGVGEAFNKWALYDNLLDSEIFAGDGKVDDFAEVGTFVSFNFAKI